jgi:hypothetical protein
MTTSFALPRARWQRWLLIVLALFVVVAVVMSFFVEEPLRRDIERRMNADLKGYEVRIGRLDFHPFGLSLDLENSIVIQKAHPKPPLAEVPNLSASVQWRELLALKLVANFRIDRPHLRLNQKQGEQEVKDETPITQRGWQDAVQEIYPLKINEFRVVDGQIEFKPDGEFKPLQMREVDILATNIRNIRSRDRVYPSELHADAVVFDNATLNIDGNADFLTKPHAGVKAEIEIGKLPLSYLTGVVHDYATIRKGTLSGKGVIEYAPKIKRVDLEDVAVNGADADYILTKANQAESEKMRVKTIQKAKEVSNDPGVQLRAKRLRMSESTLGWVDRTGSPDYRVFFSGLDLTVKDFSNQKSEGIGKVDAKGKFLGTGPSTLNAVFRPQTKSPDFDLAIRINDTDLRGMNDLLRAKANIDVTAGSMGFFSELTVRENNIDGYVKVLFHEVDVYDPAQDRHKPLLRKAYEVVAEGLAELLENRRTDQVATKANLSGPVENPDTSVWEIIGNLVRNAFFKAILPGLDQGKSDNQ